MIRTSGPRRPWLSTPQRWAGSPPTGTAAQRFAAASSLGPVLAGASAPSGPGPTPRLSVGRPLQAR
ncbi:hypothetical protein [Streptomyces werraensis]|uniref:hypothetical protein n=1 Tax=Streptomyces werraensis TaxID=68284 RepID=UPI003431F228